MLLKVYLVFRQSQLTVLSGRFLKAYTSETHIERDVAGGPPSLFYALRVSLWLVLFLHNVRRLELRESGQILQDAPSEDSKHGDHREQSK